MKNVLKKTIKWIGSNIYQVLILVAVIIGIVKLKDFAGYIGKGVRKKKSNFSRFPGDEKHIAVKTKDGWKKVELPKGVKSKNVRGAAFNERKKEKKIVVEVKHKKIRL